MRKKFVVFFTVILSALISVQIITGFSNPVVQAETLEEQLTRLDAELRALRDEKAGIQSEIDSSNYLIAGYDAQASALYGEVLVFQKEIDIIELEIKEIDLNIQTLSQKIAENKEEISVSEETIASLEIESDSRIKDSYMKYRIYGNDEGTGANLFNVDSINEYFKTVQYKDIIQDDTNKLMNDVALERQNLVVKKSELADNLVKVQEDKANVEIRKAEVDRKKADLEIKMNNYYAQIYAIQAQVNASQNRIAVFQLAEAEKQTQAERIRQELFNSFTPTAPGEYVTAGRVIGQQGCTGLCTGPHLHFSVQENGGWQDPCGYLKPGGPVGGCGWGSRLDWPITGTVYYTSPFGNRCFWWDGADYCDFHSGADFAGQPSNTPVFSAHAGYSFKGVDPYGANYVIICENTNCNQGIKTGYWHLSSF